MTGTALPSDSPQETPAEPVPGSPEYNAMMATKGGDNVELGSENQDIEGSTETPPEAPKRPEHIPEKFWNAETGEVRVEELAKSNAELEKQLTQLKQQEKAPPEGSTEEAPKTGSEPAPINFDEFYDEYAENSSLSEASYEKLSKAGIPKEVVDQYIAGQTALVDARTRQGYAMVGGEEAFNKMAAWASQSLSSEQLAAFNRAVNSSTAEMEIAMMGLLAQYEKANGKAPTLLQGGTPAVPSSTGYQSQAEMTRDMRDPRYESDPAYRKQVEAKIRATTTF